ncbi:four helix bundle protein [Fibrisoma limi]|uniref:four helix bundle protein n=1 Tax=Fibrisoma limi TaxID=663275 RepID=UPI000684DE4F|nr:four helix bundle protein [Fibrisoma limi]
MMYHTPEEKAEFAESMERRLKQFLLRCIQVFRKLPDSYEAQHFGKQLVRSSSSVASNYRAVRRSRSQNEFFAKLSITVEELDESVFWLEMLVFTDIIAADRLSDLLDEGQQLLKILSKSRSNTK